MAPNYSSQNGLYLINFQLVEPVFIALKINAYINSMLSKTRRTY